MTYWIKANEILDRIERRNLYEVFIGLIASIGLAVDGR